MDTYTRQFIVKSRQGDLLREANEARLLAAGRQEAPRSPRLAGVSRIGHQVRLLLSGSHTSPVAPRPRFGREAGDGSVTGHMVRPAGA